MKSWIWIPLAAVVGLLAGSWGPREDLKLLKERHSEDRAVRKASATSGFDAFAKLTGIPDRAKRRPPADAKPASTNAPAVATNAVAAADGPKRPSGRDRFRGPMAQEDLRARIDEAADLWRVRVELAATRWKERLGVTEGKGSADFDSAVSAMNESLRETMQALADEIESAGKVTPELGLRLMGEASRVMAETYDAIGAALPEERRAEVSEMPVFEFVDPSVAEPLIGVQDKLEGAFPERPR